MRGGGGSVQLGRLFGIRVGATPSWFIVLFVLIYLLTGYFADVLPGSSTQAFACAVAGALLFELSLVGHELGHALVARRYDVPILGIDLWFFGGLAKLGKEPDTPGREFRVAAAGPFVTLLVIVACVGASLAASRSGAFLDTALLRQVQTTPVVALLGFLAAINTGLLLFNIIPAYPLDGGRMAMAAAWRVTGQRSRGLRFSGLLGQGFAYVLIGLGIWVGLRGDTFFALQLALMGWFILQSARVAVSSSVVSERLGGVTVAELMDPSPVTIPGATAALEAQDAWFARYGWPWFPVVSDDQVFLGLLRTQAVDDAVQGGRPALTAAELADGASDASIPGSAELEELLSSQPLRNLGALMVVDAEDRLCGVVTLQQVRRALAAQAPGRVA